MKGFVKSITSSLTYVIVSDATAKSASWNKIENNILKSTTGRAMLTSTTRAEDLKNVPDHCKHNLVTLQMWKEISFKCKSLNFGSIGGRYFSSQYNTNDVGLSIYWTETQIKINWKTLYM